MAAIVAGCASASVAPQSQNASVTGSRPSTIYVYPFAVTDQEVTLNQGFFQKTFQNAGNTAQILDFTTHADSGSMSGAALAAQVAVAAAAGRAAAAASLAANLSGGAAKSYTSSTGYPAKKTADQSVNYMSQYFAQQGGLS